MLKLFLWLRYLRKRKIVFLSIAAVALSVSLLIVVASLFTGFINTFERAAVEAVGDVIVTPPIPMEKYPLLIERLEQTGAVQAATATISGYGMLYLGRGNVRAVEVWGIEPAGRAKVTGFKQFLRRQSKEAGEPSFDVPDSPKEVGGFVGIGVLTEPDEKTDEYDYDAAGKMLGKIAVLTTGTVTRQDDRDGARPDFKRQVMRFAVADIVETGVYQFDSGCVYLPIEELQKTLYPDEKTPVAGQIMIKLADNTDTDVALAVIRGVWRTFVQQTNGSAAAHFRRRQLRRCPAGILHILYDSQAQTKGHRDHQELRGDKQFGGACFRRFRRLCRSNRLGARHRSRIRHNKKRQRD
jgi:hypothetical protein